MKWLRFVLSWVDKERIEHIRWRVLNILYAAHKVENGELKAQEFVIEVQEEARKILAIIEGY
ncbi:MAG TPA: hypothetical protein VH186_32825 [Chloroflexia bacterium]|nr:hypothetical protein [Chloroflexia bacterium]